MFLDALANGQKWLKPPQNGQFSPFFFHFSSPTTLNGTFGGSKFGIARKCHKTGHSGHKRGSKWLDLGWIWVGYIQDGLLVPLGPTKIDPGGPGGS